MTGGDCQYCSRDADCVYDIERLVYRCSCRAGFTGDGITCTSIGKNTKCFFSFVSVPFVLYLSKIKVIYFCHLMIGMYAVIKIYVLSVNIGI